ncbi:hypothetical protein JCM30566_11380 [Marinitoga arctica]
MNKLAIIWATKESEVFEKLIYPYALNSKKQKWFEEVVLIIWGPSQLTALNYENYIKNLINNGIKVEACKWCSDQYNISNKLFDMNIDIKYMGNVLSDYLKDDYKVVSF